MSNPFTHDKDAIRSLLSLHRRIATLELASTGTNPFIRDTKNLPSLLSLHRRIAVLESADPTTNPFINDRDLLASLLYLHRRVAALEAVQTNIALFSDAATSSYKNLDPNLTINSITVAPTFLYYGEDATLSSLPGAYGETLSIAGAGSDPTLGEDMPTLASTDKSILFNAGKYYESSTNFASIGTEDYVVELIFRFAPVSGRYLQQYTGPAGWVFYNLNGQYLIVYIGDDVSGSYKTVAALTPGAWYHTISFFDRSANISTYVNGTSPNTQSISAQSGPLTESSTLKFASAGASQIYNDQIAYAAMWKQANWLDTSAQAAVARQRMVQLSGLYPQIAKGVADPDIVTRSSIATLDIADQSTGAVKFFQVGLHWPRVVRRQDVSGNFVSGVLIEESYQNKLTYSEDLSDASWTKTRSSITSTPQTWLDGYANTTCTVHEDATAASDHYVENSGSFNANEYECFEVYAKAINRDWIRLEINNTSGSNYNADFDLDTVAMGAQGQTGAANPIHREIQDMGGGWVRCLIIGKAGGSASTCTSRVYVAEADGDITFTGLDQDSVAVCGASLGINDFPTSYVRTSGAAITRQADTLRYPAGDNVGSSGSPARLSIVCDILINNENDSTGYVWVVSDGGSSADFIDLTVDTSTGILRLRSAATAGDAGLVVGDTVVTDGNKHSVSAYLEDSKMQLYVDGVLEGTTDVTVTVPDDLDRIDVGSNTVGGLRFSGVVSNLNIYDNLVISTTPTTTIIDSIDRLPAEMTINDITVLPDYRYRGKDNTAVSTWPAWDAGISLPLTGSGDDPTITQPIPGLPASDESVLFNGGKRYQSAGAFGNIGTEDFVLELIYQHQATSGRLIYCVAGSIGYDLYNSAGNWLTLGMRDGVTSIFRSMAPITDGELEHCLLFVDRSGSAGCYINGAFAGAQAVSTANGSLDNSAQFALGATNVGTNQYSEDIAYVAMWKAATWLDTHLQADVAAHRYALLGKPFG